MGVGGGGPGTCNAHPYICTCIHVYSTCSISRVPALDNFEVTKWHFDQLLHCFLFGSPHLPTIHPISTLTTFLQRCLGYSISTLRQCSDYLQTLPSKKCGCHYASDKAQRLKFCHSAPFLFSKPNFQNFLSSAKKYSRHCLSSTNRWIFGFFCQLGWNLPKLSVPSHRLQLTWIFWIFQMGNFLIFHTSIREFVGGFHEGFPEGKKEQAGRNTVKTHCGAHTVIWTR